MPGKYVPVKETIRGFKAIEGEMDSYPEAAFFNVGTIDEVVEKAGTMEHSESCVRLADERAQICLHFG